MKQKATDLGLKEILQLKSLEDVVFPEAVIIRRSSESAVLLTIPLPTSMPDVTCEVTKKLGNGVYTRAFLNTDGTERLIKNLVVENSDGRCPWVEHCGEHS